YDAMYLAGLIADDERMTKKDLRKWAKKACRPLAGYTVPSVAAGSPHAVELAREWIASDTELITVAGWATFSCLVSVRPDDELDLAELRKLLRHVRKSIHQAPNYVRYEMNGFVISVGSYVTSLTELTKEVGDAIGRVSVDMGNTACQVPFAPDYIRKVEQHGSLGKKRKSAKC
ncbi:MAG: DNA alkylation repair protein, partial [Pirellulaceae bacterium]